MSQSKHAAKWLSVVLAMLVAVVAVFAITVGAQRAEAADSTVTSWEQLKTAVEGASDGDVITIGNNLVVDNSKPITVKKKVTIAGDATIFQGAPSEGKYQTMFTVDGGDLTIDSGVTLSGKKSTDGISGTCPDGGTYVAENFTGDISDDGKTYDPKGFFIHVENGGTATLKGTVSDFVTSRDKANSPRYVAPIVANGTNATFNLDGGIIKNNLVGYIADDSKANTNASEIKRYVKGAGPNVPRVPNAATQQANRSSFDRARTTDAGIDAGVPGTGITATAGAVIYKDGATGSIAGTITNNRADTGGVMVSGDGTEVTIDTNALITKNVGVQFGGGSTVEQGGTITMMDGLFSENVAWFGGGAVYATENGVDWLQGRMNGSDGLSPQFEDRLDGKFEMFGGDLDSNTALTRGGAILADSDGVQITKGNLTNNMSRMLGGAVYVMGDHPLYTYTMHLTSLFVHDNVAVSGVTPGDKATENSKLQTRLSAPSACGDASGSLFSGTLDNNTDDMNDGWGTHGTGGGVWLCAYGNTVFSAGSTDKVVIADNYATGTSPLGNSVYPKWIKNSNDPVAQKIRADINYNSATSAQTQTGKTGGNDIHADTGDVGTVIIDDLDPAREDWYDENTGELYKTEVSDGRINLVNNGTSKTMSNPSVVVSGNISRRGGGLAADGTYILGPMGDQATVEAGMGVAKEWGASTARKPIMMRVSATDGTHTAFVADVPLDGVANAPANEFDTVEELAPTNNTWNGHFALPLSLTASDGTKMPVFLFHLKHDNVVVGDTTVNLDTDIDPMSFEGRKTLAALIKQVKINNTTGGEVNKEAVIAELKQSVTISFNNNLSFTLTEYEMEEATDSETGTTTWEIKTEGGQPVEVDSYIFTQKDINLDEVEYSLTSTSHYEKVWDETQSQFVEQEIFQAHIFGVNLVAPASNDNKPIAEKYVNQEVHSDIINFDQEFTYDIMAYVPKTAESFTISDTLVKGLEFANSNGGASTTPGDVVQSIAVKTTNNHQPGSNDGSVASPGEPDYNGSTINMKPGNSARLSENTTVNFGTTVDISGNTLTVSIADEPTLNVVRGKWVQVTFKARIKDEYRNLDALKALQAEVTGKTTSWEDKGTNKQGATAEVYTTANGDLSLVAELKNKVGPDEVIWAVEAPSRLFARTASGDYYATAFDKKNGAAWQILDKTTDDGQGDRGYGPGVWENADNRYNGRAPHANNTVDQIALDDAKLTTLKSMPKVVGSTVTKAAEGANRLFAEVVDAEDNTHVYACDNKQTGTGWYEVLSTDTANYNNALARLANDRYTIRMLDLETQSITLDPSETDNWPVISDEKHEGMANQAKYNVAFPGGATSNHTTNTVTVSPETAELDVAKLWSTDGKGAWPEGVGSVSFNVYAVARNNTLYQVFVGTEGVNRGKVVGTALVGNPGPANSEPLTVALTKDKRSATVEGLPRMKSFIYWAREASISDTDGNQTQLSYTGNTMNDTVNQKSTVGSLDVFTTMATSYKGDGAKFESLRNQVDKKVVRGAIADNRLWGMTLDGSYFTTAVGDTAGTGENAWTQLREPSDTDQDFMDKMLLVKRANELLGTINTSTGYMTNGTATGDGITVVDIVNVATATNATATEEKYVENAVHAEIVNFDEVFTYSVMGYVPANATKAVISDTLTKDLVLLSRDGGEDLTTANVLSAVQVYKSNNHKGSGSGTVSQGADGEDFAFNAEAIKTDTRPIPAGADKKDYEIKISEDQKTLSLTLEENYLNEVRTRDDIKADGDAGFWVKISFKAKINPESYAALQQKILSGNDATVVEEGGLTWKKVEVDTPVTDGAAAMFGGEEPYLQLNGEAHAGLLNKANYTVEFGNSGTYNHDTNEVTVKPDTVNLAFQKNWTNESSAWPEDVDAVTVGVFAQSTDGGEATLTEVLGTLETVEGYPLQANYVMPAADAQDAEQATWELTAERKSTTVVGLPRLDGVSYYARELAIDGTPVENGKLLGVANVSDYASFIAAYADLAYSKILGMHQTLINNERIEVEKYVNNDVHANLVEFDKVFKYDIMAYVSKDATEVTITDKLVGSLEFAKKTGGTLDVAGVAASSADETVEAVQVKASNDHTVDGTVAGKDAETNPGTDVLELATIDIKDNTLTVSFADDPKTDANEIASLQGKWVQVTFYAKYTDKVIRAAQIGDVETVKSNGAVLEGVTPHDGTLNKAHYTMKVGNEATVELDTNTVTVKPEYTKLTADKTWSEGAWPEGATVTFGVMAVKDGQATPVLGKLELDNNKIEDLDPDAEPAPATYQYIGEGEDPIRVELNGKPSSFIVEDLPKLIDTTYEAVELEVNGKPVEGGVFAAEEFAQYFVVGHTVSEIMPLNPDGPVIPIDPMTYVLNEKVETEKYVNNDVHADLVEFDKVFKYDILTYVSADATEVVITDPLAGALEFAKKTGGDLNAKAEKAATADEAIEAIVAKDANDHTVGSTVAGADEDNEGTPVDPTSVSIEDNTLTVTFGTEEEPVTDETGIRGKWVQVTFYAKYTDEVIKAAQIGDVETVKSNGAVLEGDTPHEGTSNQAQVTMKVENGSTANLKTNTVTVKPETTDVTVSKEWLVGDEVGEWPEGAMVDVNLLGADGQVVATDVLSADRPEVTFADLPKLIGVEYTVEEGKSTAGNYELGAVEKVSDGVYKITNRYIPEQPEIEKYVNDYVHADLVEFDRVFKYDILAYVTPDAKTVTIVDQLVPELEFAKAPAGAVDAAAAEASLDVEEIVSAVQVKDGNDHTVGGTVSQAGTELAGYEVELTNNNRALQVTFNDAAAAGIQDKWVQVTFWAKYTDAVIEAAKVGDVVTVKENGVVKEGVAPHTGTPNKAQYSIIAENGYSYGVIPTNEVTVIPETTVVEAEKVWKNFDGAALSWPADIDSVDVNVLGKDGAVVDTIKLSSGTPKGASKELPKLVGVEYVLQEEPVEGFTSAVDGSVVTNTKVEEFMEVSVTKKWAGAKSEEIPSPETFAGFLVLKQGEKDVTAEHADKLRVVDNGDFTYTATWTGLPMLAEGESYSAAESPVPGFTSTQDGAAITNTKVREEKPEIEKYINQDVHKQITLNEAFTYDIIAYVTKDADMVVVSDTLDGVLAFNGDAVAVADMGEEDNHLTNGTFTGANEKATVSAEGTAIKSAQSAIDGQTLTVTIPDATAYRGHWVRISFSAKVAEGKTLADVQAAYANVSATAVEDRAENNVGNAPVVSTKDHAGVPNNASYDIYLRHAVLDENGKPKVDEEGNEVTEVDEKPTYGDKSNTVTVRPQEEFEVTISKTDLGGTEIEGAQMKLTGPDGYEHTWTSKTSAEVLKLKPGRYTMVEVVAPEGFAQVTTEMVFVVNDDGSVKLETVEVDGGGAITAEGNHIELADAPAKHVIEITKADIVSGDELEGATIRILDKDGNEIEKWLSGKEAHKLLLEAGEYTLEEVAAPDGYEVTTTVRFSVDDKGNVTVLNAEEVNQTGKIEWDVNHLVLSDRAKNYLTVEASTVTKVWADGGNDKNRAPVTFQLYYRANGGQWAPLAGKTVTIEQPDANGVWAAAFEGLPEYVNGSPVEYYAAEANADSFAGFYTPGEEIIVTSFGGAGMSATNQPVFSSNREVLISKRAMGATEELAGATLQVLDATGAVVENGEWVTDGTQKAFNLPVGLYTLHEVAAPAGYELAPDVKFRINVDAEGTMEVLEGEQWVPSDGVIVMYDALSEEEEVTPKPSPEKPTPTSSSGKVTAKPNAATSATPRAAASTSPAKASTATVKTGDEAGMPVAVLGVVAVASIAVVAFSLRRRRMQR